MLLGTERMGRINFRVASLQLSTSHFERASLIDFTLSEWTWCNNTDNDDGLRSKPTTRTMSTATGTVLTIAFGWRQQLLLSTGVDLSGSSGVACCCKIHL